MHLQWYPAKMPILGTNTRFGLCLYRCRPCQSNCVTRCLLLWWVIPYLTDKLCYQVLAALMGNTFPGRQTVTKCLLLWWVIYSLTDKLLTGVCFAALIGNTFPGRQLCYQVLWWVIPFLADNLCYQVLAALMGHISPGRQTMLPCACCFDGQYLPWQTNCVTRCVGVLLLYVVPSLADKLCYQVCAAFMGNSYPGGLAYC